VENQYSLTWLSQLQGQAGVISRQQASEVGVTTKAIEWKLRSGAWQRLQPGIYATFTGEPPREAKLWAAVLRAGPGAALSHESAAEVHGLIDKPATQIHVSVPTARRPGQQSKIRGMVIHRSRRLALEWQPPWQLPRTTVEDTVLDLAAAARSFDDAYGWISTAIGRRRTTPQRLSKALAGRSRMRWRDIHRDNANLVQGVQTLRYSWPDTTQNRCQTAAQIAAVLRRHGWPGTLRPCGPTCQAAK
jgi:hypothetical protein